MGYERVFKCSFLFAPGSFAIVRVPVDDPGVLGFWVLFYGHGLSGVSSKVVSKIKC